jgi:uncharacterized membrane protein
VPLFRDAYFRQTMLNVLRFLHIFAGAVCLLTFSIPLLAKKGARVHRTAGWIFTSMMAVIATTAIPISIVRLLDDDRANDRSAIFLIYVALLAAGCTAAGLRALAVKRGTVKGRLELGMSLCFVFASLALVAWGAASGGGLFIGFGTLGAALGAARVRFWLKPSRTKMEWFLEHMAGMGGSAIATLTAFAVVNAGRLGLADHPYLLWLGPGLIGGFGLTLWSRSYRRRFGSAAAPT